MTLRTKCAGEGIMLYDGGGPSPPDIRELAYVELHSCPPSPTAGMGLLGQANWRTGPPDPQKRGGSACNTARRAYFQPQSGRGAFRSRRSMDLEVAVGTSWAREEVPIRRRTDPRE